MKEFERYVDYKPPLRKSVSIDKITIEKNEWQTFECVR